MPILAVSSVFSRREGQNDSVVTLLRWLGVEEDSDRESGRDAISTK